MKHLFFILFSLVIYYNYSQEQTAYDQWLNSYEEGVSAYKANQFNEAIPKLTEATNFIDKIDFNSNKDAVYYPVYNYDYLGLSYYALGQYENAAEAFFNALNIISTIESKDESYLMKILENLIFSYQQYDPDLALEFANQALKGIAENKGKGNILYAEQLFILFRLNNSMQNSEMAIQNLEEAFNIHNKLSTTNHIHYPYIVFNLGYLYYHLGNYENAIPYLRMVINSPEQYEADNFVNFSKLTYDYGYALYKNGNYDEATSVLKKVLDDPWLVQPENTEWYLLANHILSLSLSNLGKNKESNLIYLNSLEYLKDQMGTLDPLYNLQKTNYVKFLISTDQNENALVLSQEIYSDLKDTQHTNSKAYINTLNNLGILYQNKSEFEKSKNLLEKALALTIQNTPEDHFNIANIESNLAYQYQQLGNYEKARELQLKVLRVKQNYLNSSSSELALVLGNFATYLYQTGEYIKAEEYTNKALRILNSNGSQNSTIYAKLLLNKAQISSMLEQTKQSLIEFDQVIQILETSGNTNSEIMVFALQGKADILYQLNSLDESEKLGKASYNLAQKLYGEEALQMGDAAKDLGSLLYRLGKYNESYTYFNKAFQNYEKYLEYGDPRFAVILSFYIDDLLAQQKYDKALELIEKLEKNILINFGPDSFEYAKTLNQKAFINQKKGNYEYALRLYSNVKNTFEKSVGKENTNYNQMLFEYALTADKAKQNSKAKQLYIDYSNNTEALLKTIFTYRSEKDKKAFMQKLQLSNDWINGTLFSSQDRFKALNGLGLNNQLVLKSLLLNSSKEILSDLAKLKDVTINEKIDRYNSIKFQLADPKVMINAQRSADLRSELNNLETDLVKLHEQNFNANDGNTNFKRDWTAIKSNLKPNEIAIEFVEYETRNENVLTGKRAYGAYLIHADWEQPKLVQLTFSETLKSALNNKTPNQLYNSRGSKAQGTANTLKLYDLIWKPMEAHLDGIETVYFSTSGVLNQIPFSALDSAEQPILAERFNLVQLSSTFLLNEINSQPQKNNTLFIGGIDYEEASDSMDTNTTQISSLDILKTAKGTRNMGSSWTYLPGTLSEIENLQTTFAEKNLDYQMLSGKNATETTFKKLSGNSPSIIHIATHGFFFENPKNTASTVSNLATNVIYKQSEDPLLRSGLIFAGANEAWTKGSNPSSLDDGILTALEISSLDLSNTDMVVLSACETGLGDIDGNEGVYGLQRAFKMAGVDIIVMSLWEVPDKETAEFMNLFYTHWLSEQDIRTAFRETQLEMSTKYKANPEKWAAFVLFE